MPAPSKTSDSRAAAPNRRLSQARKLNRLKDDVYREMLRLEVKRPGAEMALALALLRAVVHEGSTDQEDFAVWSRTVCQVGLRMIEDSLGEGATCERNQTKRKTMANE